MNTRTNILAAAAVIATFAVPAMASAEPAIFLPSTYSWGQVEATGIPADAHGQVTIRHHVHGAQPYGQW